ncbi:uncharacterized protein LOC133888539 [Phragmites australis]|uniref:uncharacterized protein LOC133888539 n=1 Tax=Phragmites australis TaxID=29695 RepID=UPI002D779664|nr:uncharacterized protein LOC133888539 [Phragmites australis]
MKGAVEVKLTKDTPARRGWGWWRDDGNVDDGDVGVVRIGRNLAIVDTTFSESDEVTKRWLAEAASLARGRHLRAPLVAGLVALRGRDPSSVDRYWWRADSGFSPHDPANPIRCVALCLGGSRVLVYCPNAHGFRIRRHERSPVNSRLVFYGNNMNKLRAFLDDKRITVACFGPREAAKKLANEWGLHVARPAELTDLFARAYGKEAGVDAEKAKPKKRARYWMGKAALARARAKAERDDYDSDDDEEGTNQWKRAEKVVRGLSLERMALVALGREMRLARCPAKVADADWSGRFDLGEEEWAYATRDAYLCFEIAARCLQKLGIPIGA